MPIPKLPMSERVKFIDPKVTRARKRRRMVCVLLLFAGAVAYVRQDVVRPWLAEQPWVAKQPWLLEFIKLPAEVPAGGSKTAAKQVRTIRPAVPVVTSQPVPPKPDAAPTMVKRTPVVAPESLGALRLEMTEFPAEQSWPRQISLTGVPRIDVVEENAEAGEFVYRSAHYDFRSDTKLGPDVVREFARVFEATHLAVCKLPLDFRPAPENMRTRFTAQLFKSEKQYLEAGGMEGSAGCYKRAQKSILVPLDSLGVRVLNGGRTVLERGGAANATLIHEITHQMMNHWLPRLPIWYTEGAAEYMVVAEYLHGRFNFNQVENLLRQYLNRRGSRDASFTMLRPAELMALDSRTWSQSLAGDSGESRQNYVSALLLALYFHHLDVGGEAIIAYLRAIEKGQTENDACRDHLLRDRSFETLESEMKRAFSAVGVNLSFDSRGGQPWRSESEARLSSDLK